MFPCIPNPLGTPKLNFSAPETFTMNSDPRTSLGETKVQKILHLQALAEKLLDGFADGPRVTKLSPLGIRLDVLAKTPRKRKAEAAILLTDQEFCLEPKEELAEANKPLDLDEARQNKEWLQWEATIQAKYASLRKHHVFSELIHTLTSKPVGYKLIFMKKRDAQSKLLRFKVQLVAQGFSQRPRIDYDSNYSSVMDLGTFRYLLGLVVQTSLQTQLLDVVIAYLHGPLETRLYIKPPSLFCETKLPPP